MINPVRVVIIFVCTNIASNIQYNTRITKMNHLSCFSQFMTFM